MTADLETGDSGWEGPAIGEPTPAHVAPTISYLGTLADLTLGGAGPADDGFGSISGP